MLRQTRPQNVSRQKLWAGNWKSSSKTLFTERKDKKMLFNLFVNFEIFLSQPKGFSLRNSRKFHQIWILRQMNALEALFDEFLWKNPQHKTSLELKATYKQKM